MDSQQPHQEEIDQLIQNVGTQKEKQVEADIDQEELNAVIESISFGKAFQHKRLTFQAFSAAISHSEQVRFVVNYLGNLNNSVHQKFPTAKNKMLAYRVSQTDQIKQQDAIQEGFDDDGEAGAGEKLLGLLQKMEIENIMIIICIWSNGAQIGTQQVKGGELFKIIIERARELLTSIHEQIVLTELEQKKQSDHEQLLANQGKRRALGPKLFSLGASANQESRVGMKGNSQFKTSLIIGNQRNRSPIAKGDNTFDNLLQSQSQGGSQENTDDEADATKNQPDQIEDLIVKGFPEELTYEEYEEASKEVEESVRQLTKASIMELKQFSKPHPLIERTLNIVCALRGFKNYNWSIAKEIMSKAQFKMELMQTKPKTLRPQDVLKAQKILNSKSNVTLTPQNVHLHSEGAALLLVWAANIIKVYACHRKFGELNDSKLMQQQPLQGDDIQRITNRTKIMVQKEQQYKKIADKDELQENLKIAAAKQDPNMQQNQDGSQSRQQQVVGQKSSTIGHFLKNKQMVFSMDTNALAPEKQLEQKPPNLVDLSVIKKGGFNSVTNKSKMAQRQEDQLLRQEEQRMIEESQFNINPYKSGVQSQLQSNLLPMQQPKAFSVGKRSLNASKAQDQEKQGKSGARGGVMNNKDIEVPGLETSQENFGDDHFYSTTDDQRNAHNPQLSEDIPGKLRMHEVRELSDDVDNIIGQLKGVDYGIQDLDILIELAKQLKHKRLTLFPDTSNVLMNENFASYTSPNIDEEDTKK